MNTHNDEADTEALKSIDWIVKMALYVQREKQRLPVQQRQLVDDMVAQAGPWPTELQCRYLHSLFLKLGGKIT
jgi:hypothetical protein